MTRELPLFMRNSAMEDAFVEWVEKVADIAEMARCVPAGATSLAKSLRQFEEWDISRLCGGAK